MRVDVHESTDADRAQMVNPYDSRDAHLLSRLDHTPNQLRVLFVKKGAGCVAHQLYAGTCEVDRHDQRD